MELEDRLRRHFNESGFNLIDLTNSLKRFQNFLESVPDFFIERQGSEAHHNQAKEIIDSLPPNHNGNDKLLFGAEHNHEIIGFFEILLNYPTKELLAAEDEQAKEKLGNLDSNRFTVGFLVIRHDYRNLGIGSQYMDILESVLLDSDYQYSHLVVNNSNKKVMRFYESLGYQVVKRTEQEIGDIKHNCFILIKKLSKQNI